MASNAKLFTGKQLLENGAKKSDSLLPTKGAKSVIPSGSWLEKKQIESALEARKRVLGGQRIEKRSTITQAEWIDEEQKALVTEKKGSQWLHMGQTINSQTYLLPEETLHLMEINSLELKYGGVPVSIQQAYTILIGKSVSLNEYRVYSLLSKQGYKLIRFDKTRVYAKDITACDIAPQHDAAKGVEKSQEIINHSDQVVNPLIEESQLNTTSNNNLETPNESGKLDSDCPKEPVEKKKVSSTETNGETVVLDAVDIDNDVVKINETELIKSNHAENNGEKDAVEDDKSTGVTKDVIEVDPTQLVNNHSPESLEVSVENETSDDMSLENSSNDTSSIGDPKDTKNKVLINNLGLGDNNHEITESDPTLVKSNNSGQDVSDTDKDSLEDMCLVYTSDDSDSTEDPKVTKKEELINSPEKNGTRVNDNSLEKERTTSEDMCLEDTSSESDSIEDVERKCFGHTEDDIGKELNVAEINEANFNENHSSEKVIDAGKITLVDMNLVGTSDEADSIEEIVEDGACLGDTNEELVVEAIEAEKNVACSTKDLKDTKKVGLIDNGCWISTNQEAMLNADSIEEDVEEVNSTELMKRHSLEEEINAEKTTEDMCLADTSSESDSIETSVEDNVLSRDAIDVIEIEKDVAEVDQANLVNDRTLEKDKTTAEDMCLDNSSDETESIEDLKVTKEERPINGKCSGDAVDIIDIEKHGKRVDQADLVNNHSSEKENISLDDTRLRDINEETNSIEVHMEVEKGVPEVNNFKSKKQDIQATEDKRSASCCMDIDSSSDDCMVVGDSPGDVDNSKGATDVEKPNDTEINIDSHLSNDSDAMEIQYLPSFSFKLKILDAIPNCYHKTIIYLKAPDQKFIPPDINLTKRNFIVMLNKLSDKSNMNDGEANLENYYDEYPHNTRDPKLKCITNFSHEEDVRQTTNTQNSRNFNSHYMGRNNFANNTYFWNHIFHQLSSRQANFFNNFQFPHLNGMFGRVNNLSNNYGQRPSFFPQFNNRGRFASNFFFQPFNLFCNRPNLFPHSEPSSTFSNYNNSCSSGRDNTFSQMFNNRTNAQSHSNHSNRKRCRNQNSVCHKSNPLTSKNSTRKKEKTCEASNSNAPSKETILSHIKALLSRYSIISPNEQSEELRKALKLAVDQFNMNFNENYVLDFKTPQCLLRRMSVNSNRCHEVLLFDLTSNQQEPDRVLQLSSDSDCGSVKVSRLNNNSPASDSCVKKKARRKLRSKRSKSETKLTFQVNTSHSSSDSDFHSSSEEENGQSKRKSRRFDKQTESSAKIGAETQPPLPPSRSIKNNIETFSKYKRRVVIDHSNDNSVFGGWFPRKDSWSRPVYSALKPRHSHIPAANLKISYAILNNIRELSYEKEYSLESWGQAKKLFERRNDSGTVCISDDESMPNDPADSRLNEITIKLDKIHPLVRPEDCKSVSTVLDRLQVISSVNDDPYFGAVIDESERLKISYNMYSPNFKNFRKTDPPPPAFSIVVLSDTSPMPCPAAMSQVAESLPPSVPFLLAVVSFDAVSFIQMEHITLPNMKRSCET